MEIQKPMRVEKVAYRCVCKTCGTRVDVEKNDLHYAGGLKLYWMCPVCCFEQRESIIKLNTKRVIYYTDCKKK